MLSSDQFFHVAPRGARGAIDKHGIDYRRGSPQWEETEEDSLRANYMTPDIDEARGYRKMAEAMSRSDEQENWQGTDERYDIWQVHMPDKHARQLAPDPLTDSGVMRRAPVPRSWTRRIE